MQTEQPMNYAPAINEKSKEIISRKKEEQGDAEADANPGERLYREGIVTC